MTRLDQTADSHQANNQSEARHVQKLQTCDNERNNSSSLLQAQTSIRNLHTNFFQPKYYYKNKGMDIKTVESIERKYPSEETLAVTKRWREITKPGDYRYTQGQWKRYNFSKNAESLTKEKRTMAKKQVAVGKNGKYNQ